jgi:hypothetical protein
LKRKLLCAKPSCLEICDVVCSDIQFGPERHHSRQIDKRGFSQSLTISVENYKLGINRISDADCYLWNAISEAVRSM